MAISRSDSDGEATGQRGRSRGRKKKESGLAMALSDQAMEDRSKSRGASGVRGNTFEEDARLAQRRNVIKMKSRSKQRQNESSGKKREDSPDFTGNDPDQSRF